MSKIYVLWGASESSSESEKWAAIQNCVSVLLAATDKYMLPDAPEMTAEERAAIMAYRRALMRVQLDYNNPDDVIIPEMPAMPSGEPQAEIPYSNPIKVPIVTAGEYIQAPELRTEEVYIYSPTPEDTPEKALAKAVEISKMDKKGLARMVVNMLTVMVEQDKQIKELKEKIK